MNEIIKHVSENKKKIEDNYLEVIENHVDLLYYFGKWVDDVEKLSVLFKNAKPFESIVIDNFLDSNYAELLYKQFPNTFENWWKYENPIEVKYTFDNINVLPSELKNYFYIMSSNVLVNIISKLTGINNLEKDDYLHGAGLHVHPQNGRLNIHLDYEKHPFSGKERRINVILFMSKNWKPEWNGANELWDKNASKCVKTTNIKFNRAIIFKTNDISWHGVPDKILCPENIFRKSIAYYYVSPLESIKNEEDYRHKAKFVRRPNDIPNDGVERLYEIRSNRRIEKTDLQKFVPWWNPEI